MAELNSSGTMNGVSCGDTIAEANTHQTDWRMPNVRELLSLLNFQFTHPVISNAAGTGNGTVSDPFSNFLEGCCGPLNYWSSDTVIFRTNAAYVVGFTDCHLNEGNKNGYPNYGDGNGFVIAVHGGR
jgi:hypothetical protein